MTDQKLSDGRTIEGEGGAAGVESVAVGKWAAAGSMLAAVGLCATGCLLPFALAALGMGGAWVGQLRVLVPYKPILVATSMVLLGCGFYAMYWNPRSMGRGQTGCVSCPPSRAVQIVLWVAVALTVVSIAFDYLEPYVR